MITTPLISDISEPGQLLRLCRPGLGNRHIGKRQAVVQELPDIAFFGHCRYRSAFVVRQEQQHFVQAYSVVAQQFRGVGADQNLPAGTALHTGEHLGQGRDDFRVQRQFGGVIERLTFW